jgi:hypothetical protein
MAVVAKDDIFPIAEVMKNADRVDFACYLDRQTGEFLIAGVCSSWETMIGMLFAI